MSQGEYFSHWASFHPPFKLILTNIFFGLFGYESYTIIGFVLGIVGIYALYLIGVKLFDKKVALLSAFLLATSGLYLSVSLFSITDFVVTVLFLVAFVFYSRSKYWLYAVFAALAVLTKETAIFLTFGILITEFFQQKKRIVPLLLPILTIGLWIGFLYSGGHHLWNDYNFSPTARYGSTLTIILNLITLHFLNQYAFENWLHLFVFNFNWVYTAFAGVSLFLLRKKLKTKEFMAIGISSLLFCVLSLSFQTWTINRYVLPLLPFLYLFASYSALETKYRSITLVLLVLIAFISLSHSVDPVSNLIWPKTKLFNQTLYLKPQSDGPDGITYNLQYLQVLQKRNTKILHNQCHIPEIISYRKPILRELQITTCQ